MALLPRRLVSTILGITILTLLYLLYNHDYTTSPFSLSSLPFASSRVVSRDLLGAAHIAVFEQEDFHDEVHGAILWTLNQFPDVQVSFYRKPWRWGFANVIESWYTTPPIDPTWFLDQLKQETTIQYVFLPTTDFSGKDWDNFQPKLKKIWLERRPEEKFKIIMMRHWGKYDLTETTAWWAERDALSVVTLGDHVSTTIRDTQVREGSGQRYEKGEAEGLLRMRVETFIPIFKPQLLSSTVEHTTYGKDELEAWKADDHERLDMALIQSGNFDEGHRGMHAIFTELKEDLIADPALWGYQLDAETKSYIPIPDQPRFVLKILGFGGVGAPKELENMVSVERYLPYQHYYDRVAKADIVLPAFGHDSYDENRASSTMGVAATAMTPLLVTQKTADAYGWFCPAFAIIRPSDITEIEWIRRVRKGLIPWRSRPSIKNDLQDCQYDWTTKNMDVVSRLFKTNPQAYVPPAKEGVEEIIEAELRVPGE